MPTTQDGWPVLDPSSPLLHLWVIPTCDGTTHLSLRNGSAGFLLCHLALVFDTKVEDLQGPTLDDWGYAYRPVRGYDTVWSDHAGGVAEDLNAVKHPLGKEGTFTAADHAKIEKVLEHYDGVLGWGGNYHNRKDEMHFEIADGVKMPAVEKVARRLMDSKRGQIILKANPGQREVILS